LIIELRTGKGTHSLSGILNIDAKRSIINPRFNNRPANCGPGYADYEQRTAHEIPMVILRPLD
jgi:hypothetical protein